MKLNDNINDDIVVDQIVKHLRILKKMQKIRAYEHLT